ncbi:hypothetical protein B0A52_06703 [Exophiala mesophila]|uniref:DNA excision repair protein ERCC-6-like 2 n=1 Tax=Exophiala mesophila TaxID=212818 RepID=A0A438N1N8_EXOME|nr:hypothetical protein B0A52_06703 [Exophiala mesophila]
MASSESEDDEDDLDLDPPNPQSRGRARAKSPPLNIMRRGSTPQVLDLTLSPPTDAYSSDASTSAPIRRRNKRKASPPGPQRLDWDNDGIDGEDDFEKYEIFKAGARKRAQQSAIRARKLDQKNNPPPRSRTAGATTGVGRQSNRQKRSKRREYGDESNPDEDLMEWTTPAYFRDRRARFDSRTEKLKQGGLLLPPSYSDIEFSDDENLQTLAERPDFPPSTATNAYQNIELPYSLGLIPASIAQFLRGYQIAGASFLHELFVYQKGGILGDDMGLGKTVQVIAFLTAAYGKTGDERDHKRMRKMRKAQKWYPRTLIICPGTLMENWRDEFRRWGWWHTDLYHGGVRQRSEVLEIARAGMLEVMITTYHTYRANINEINMIQWDCVIADECHTVKERRSDTSKAMNDLNALCRIGLTGTAIQNKYEELWTLLNWTNPGKLGPISTWKTSVCEPLKLGQSHDATNYQLARARKTAKLLRDNLLPQFFLRRTKEIIKHQLPKKSDRVVFCPLTPTQAEAYQNYLDSEVVDYIKNNNDPCMCGSGKKAGWCCRVLLSDGTPWQSMVFPAMANLHHLSNHLALLIPQSSDNNDKQAKDLDVLQIVMPGRWKEIYRNRDSIMHTGNPEFCGKWRVLRKLLSFWHDQGENKVLIFSHSVRLLKMLQNLFISTKYNVKYLDGSMQYEERYAAVQEFNTDPTQFVFLISTKAGGVGLNITSANKVVVVDPNWNPSYDLQAQDRAYRIGQTRDVEVFRLISQGTLEEIIYARQIYKQQQANIGYSATTERRYFQGVQGRKDQKGEIFGLKNMFAYQNEHTVLRDIVNKTNIAESRADIKVALLELDGEEADSNQLKDEEDIANRIKRDPESENAAMSQLAAEITGEVDKVRAQSKTPFRHDGKVAGKHDPVQAILSSAGVSYTHENSEVVGPSKVEALLSKRAEEYAEGWYDGGTQEQLSKVFEDDSHVHDQLEAYTYSGEFRGITTPGGEVRYKYRPPEAVMKRQFCSMADWAGYGDDVVAFALVVESWTQAQRRECLERFYRFRRDVLEELAVGGTEVAAPRVASSDIKSEPQSLIKSEWKSEGEDIKKVKSETQAASSPEVKTEVKMEDTKLLVKNESDVETVSEDEDDEL